MEKVVAAGGHNSAVFDKGKISSKMLLEPDFLLDVVRLYFKDSVYGSYIKNKLGIGLEDFHDMLDDTPELANKFNEKLCEVASNRIERNVDVCIAHLVDELTKSSDDIQSLRVIQSSIQTLSVIKKTYQDDPLKANKKLSDFERALMEYGG